ncbi:hypothetical protein AQUCO_00300066v1 [Aquilegia coerulea]|uniref:Uncharacterized protein n=1 Tax=Aquilegia coerulea TaxID=218851 RepID=A0A2G5EX53_AQUCA|nr:hypothetical protein AQUCO_00300066v1 [Aquilegia coerulea]
MTLLQMYIGEGKEKKGVVTQKMKMMAKMMALNHLMCLEMRMIERKEPTFKILPTTMLQSDDPESEHEDEPIDTDQEDGIDDNGQSRRSVDI